LWLGLPTYTQEFGQSFVYAFRNGKSEPIFATDGAEGIDAAENGDLFVVEDKPSGSLLKYSKKSGSVVALVDGLNQAEGVCVMDSGTIYYVEKSSDTVFQIVKGSIMPFVSGLTKPAYLHCDENRNGVWITEDRRHFGRLLFARVGGSFQIIATGLSSPQSLDFDDDGNLFLAEQGKNRILKFTPQDRYLASYGDL
jgi:sugar lactone lactonase YvrE